MLGSSHSLPSPGTRRADHGEDGHSILHDGSFAAAVAGAGDGISQSELPMFAIGAAAGQPNATAPPLVPPREIGGRAKRTMDICLALLALVLLMPVMLLTALLVRVFMGAPVIFAHNRVGRNGTTFKCYKFRTMVSDADGVLAHHLETDATAAVEWQATRKLRRDPRVTILGRALRKSSLDELPQLVNVLRGEMSCVGPRPIVREELALYGPYAAAYLSTRPGLTGAWQVSGRSSLSYDARVALDYGYVRDWSLWRDIAIIIRTIPAVMSHDDAA
jgi:exopolysaccharide production protein ExoY